MTPRTTRMQRLAMPLARQVVRDLAAGHGGCIRPVQLRRTDLHTGQVQQVLIPCGHTLASVCPACAERARTLRAAQCREGWHLDTEPVITPGPATGQQRTLVTRRAEAQQQRDHASASGHDTAGLDELAAGLDEDITRSGLRGNVLPGQGMRRHRTTRRRQDTPDLPRRPVAPATIGKTYTAPGGTTYRPSMFLTLTCDSYGKVTADGTPANPDSYDYQRAARDALHFAALFDRLVQNLRRLVGYDLQYFAAVEPQRRLAPHVHVAIRGTVSRAELRQVIAATYHQVWWPPPAGSSTTTRTCPSGTRPPAGTSTPRPASSCPPGTTRSTPSDRTISRCTSPGSAQVRRPGRARRKPRLGPVHRLPDQVPDQADSRLPPRGHRPPARARGPAGRRAAIRAVLPGLRELAALRRPAQERPPGPAARPLHRQSPPL